MYNSRALKRHVTPHFPGACPPNVTVRCYREVWGCLATELALSSRLLTVTSQGYHRVRYTLRFAGCCCQIRTEVRRVLLPSTKLAGCRVASQSKKNSHSARSLSIEYIILCLSCQIFLAGIKPPKINLVTLAILHMVEIYISTA